MTPYTPIRYYVTKPWSDYRWRVFDRKLGKYLGEYNTRIEAQRHVRELRDEQLAAAARRV